MQCSSRNAQSFKRKLIELRTVVFCGDVISLVACKVLFNLSCVERNASHPSSTVEAWNSLRKNVSHGLLEGLKKHSKCTLKLLGFKLEFEREYGTCAEF